MKKLVLRMAAKLYRSLEQQKNFSSDPLANIDFLNDALSAREENKNNEHQKNIINRIIFSYHAAKEKQQTASLAYQPGGAWKKDIKDMRSEYLNALESRDIQGLSELLRNFFRNSGISGLWKYGYYKDILNAGNGKKKWFINNILSDYKTLIDYVDHFDVASLEIPQIGNPWGYKVKGTLVLPTSCNHYYYATHVKNLIEDIETPVVCEIGGGFGGFAYYLLSTDKSIKYINLDLPEVLIIAQYYLMKAYPDKKTLLYGENGTINISEKIINSYDIILMPNFVLPNLPDRTIDLSINTKSLSEMNYYTVEEYINQIARITKTYFYHDNSDRDILNTNGHIEVKSSNFPLPHNIFKRIYKGNSLWGGGGGRYREHLYQRKKA